MSARVEPRRAARARRGRTRGRAPTRRRAARGRRREAGARAGRSRRGRRAGSRTFSWPLGEPALGVEQPHDLDDEQRVAVGLGVDRRTSSSAGSVPVGQLDVLRRRRARPARRARPGRCAARARARRAPTSADRAAPDRRRGTRRPSAGGQSAISRATKRRSSSDGSSAACRSSSTTTSGRSSAALPQERGRGLEQAEARAVGLRREGLAPRREVAQLGQQLREIRGAGAELVAQRVRVGLAAVRAQRLHPRPVRRRAARLPAAADQHVRGAPARLARSSSSVSRLLPIPGSPATRTRRARGRRARRRARRRASRARARGRRTRLRGSGAARAARPSPGRAPARRGARAPGPGARIACWSSRSARPGSIPARSTSAARVAW